MFWNEFVQAISMMPVFIVHLWHKNHTVAQSWIGMVHAVFSCLSHLNIWWWQQEGWPLWAVELHIADKCLIMAMVWGFHYHFEPSFAKTMALPCLVNTSHIILYQQQYINNRYAYFDIVLLTYCAMTTFDYIKKTPENIIKSLFLWVLCVVGYGMDIPGLMHICLAPAFWMWYNFIQYSKKENFFIK